MKPPQTDTREQLLGLATRLIQQVGHSGFSYRDLAARAGITTASIHYHFPAKADLLLAVVARFRAAELADLAAIDAAGGDAAGRLRRFVQAYRDMMADGERMCLCGMLAAEHQSLPPAVAAAVHGFFTDVERWLAGVLRAGRRDGTLAAPGPAAPTARAFFSGVEGAVLVAKAFADPGRFDEAVRWHLDRLRG